VTLSTPARPALAMGRPNIDGGGAGRQWKGGGDGAELGVGVVYGAAVTIVGDRRSGVQSGGVTRRRGHCLGHKYPMDDTGG
jgi:hypothetical protein